MLVIVKAQCICYNIWHGGVRMDTLQLNMMYRELDRDLAQYMREAEHDKVFIPHIERKLDIQTKLGDLAQRLVDLPTETRVHGILKSHLADYLAAQMTGLDSRFEKPARYIQGFMWMFYSYVRNDSRPDDVKYDEMVKRLGKAAEVYSAIKGWINDVSPMNLKAFTDMIRVTCATIEVEVTRLGEYFPSLTDSQISEMSRVLTDLSRQMCEWRSDVEVLLAKKGLPEQKQSSDDDIIRLDVDYYRGILRNEVGVNLDEILAWHEAEIEKTRAEVFEIMSKINIPDPMPRTMEEVNNILLKYAGPCDTPEEMFRRGNEYIKRTQAAAQEYVWMPVGEVCDILPVYEQLKVSYPWGGYGGGCPRRRPLRGQMFLNNYNFRAVTDGWIKMNTVHEAYPGHHVQFLRTTVDPLPATVKYGAKSTPITEGTAHRSERLFEFVFEEDPFFALFVAYRRHHTAVRIKIDLMLRYYGNPISDAVALYQKELGFERHIARGQVQAHEDMLGYFTSYYYGMKKLCDWEKQYGFDKKTYTEMLFAAGRISLENFEQLLKLSEPERQSYYKDFESLVEIDDAD